MAKKTKETEVEVILNDDETTDDLSFLDWQAPDEQLDTELYPFVQWNNNEGAWEFPLEHWGGSQIDQDYETVEVVHNFGQDTEPAMLVPQIHIAVIAQRFAWEGQDAEGKRFYSATYEDGLHKRYNFLCLIKEAGNAEPAIITARSYTGAYIQNAIKQHRNTVLKLASRKANGTRFPLYMFWLPLVAGEKVYVGSKEKSQITPPVPAFNALSEIDQAGIADILKSLYISNEYRNIINSYLYREGESWANEYRSTLLLSSGNSGVSNEAQVLPGGVLYLPDLSEKKPSDWIECAMSIPGLFNAPSHASNALAKVLRERHLGRASTADQWEAFRDDIEKRFANKSETEQAVARELELRD